MPKVLINGIWISVGQAGYKLWIKTLKMLFCYFLDNLQKGVNNFAIEHKIANLVVGGAVPP